MKNIFLLLFLITFTSVFSQESKVYSFFVELNSYSNAPKFKYNGRELIYDGKDNKEKEFFVKHTILDFHQSFPDSRRQRTLNMFTMYTYDKDLMTSIIKTFPDKYLRIEDLSDIKIELLETYTNDYGSTSPPSITNLGLNASFKNLDYINVPKAWDYTMGNSNVIIGISDAKVQNTDLDLQKTTFSVPSSWQNQPYDEDNSYTWHGTSVAAISAAQGNNAHGMSGICSNCGIIATALGYGSQGSC